MKLGQSLQELAAEIERQAQVKRDYVTSTANMRLTVSPEGGISAGPTVRLELGDELELGLKPLAHAQIAEYTKVPKGYYDRMLAEAPALLTRNVNEWFWLTPTKRMTRTLDGSTRAFLSDAYRPLDNYDLLEAALPRLVDLGVEVVSSAVTETRLYLKVVDKRIKRDLPTGAELGQGHHRVDTVSPALVLSNSEVGVGALSVQTSVWTSLCTNLVVINERSTRKYHVGARAEIGEQVYAMLSEGTRRLTDAALWAQLGDVVTAAFDQARFDATVEKIAATTRDKIEAPDPVKVVEVTAKKFGLNDSERGSVLTHLIRGGDLTRYGLFNAVTRSAEDADDYDRASELERLGGKIVELPRGEWAEIAKAA